MRIERASVQACVIGALIASTGIANAAVICGTTANGNSAWLAISGPNLGEWWAEVDTADG